jgi:hypothetical protein
MLISSTIKFEPLADGLINPAFPAGPGYLPGGNDARAMNEAGCAQGAVVAVFSSPCPLKQLDKPRKICYVSTASKLEPGQSGRELSFSFIDVVLLPSGGDGTKGKISR